MSRFEKIITILLAVLGIVITIAVVMFVPLGIIIACCLYSRKLVSVLRCHHLRKIRDTNHWLDFGTVGVDRL